MLVSTNIHSNNLIHFNYGINQYLCAHCIFCLLLQTCRICVQNRNENRIAKLKGKHRSGNNLFFAGNSKIRNGN
jgi:hypothetical protein